MSKIKVYSTPTCSYCRLLKDFLKEKGVKFEDIDVSADQEVAREMIEKLGQMGGSADRNRRKDYCGF